MRTRPLPSRNVPLGSGRSSDDALRGWRRPASRMIVTDARPAAHHRFRVAHRVAYGGAAVLTIALGLASRRVTWLFPAALGKYPGDALYAVLVYWLLAQLAPRISPLRTAMVCTALCWGVEFLQLWHPPWLQAIRGTTPGHLVLGSSFAAMDLLAYAAGASVAAAIEGAALRWQRARRAA